MEDWLTLDKAKLVVYLITVIAGAVGWYDSHQQRNETQATREQVTTIVNYYYEQGCKP